MQAAGRSLAPMDSRKDATPSKKSPTMQVSRYTFDEEPTLRANNVRTNSSPMPRSYSSSYTERPPVQKILQDNAPREARKPSPDMPESDPKRIFKALEDYVVACFGSFECINSSFSTHPRPAARHVSEATRRKPMPSDEPREQRGHRRAPSENHALREQRQARTAPPVEDSTFDLDPKMLLLGDFAENGTWWMGNQEESRPRRPSAHRTDRSFSNTPVSTKTPSMNWNDLMTFYTTAVNPAKGWFAVYEDLCRDQNFQTPPQRELQSIERELLQGQEHARRVLLKATEMLLKRPGRPLKDPADLRFLLIVLENPLLHENEPLFYGILQPENNSPSRANFSRPRKTSAPETGLLSGQHSGIIKRIVGLISNSSPECHNQLITWFARHHPSRFIRTKEIASGFLTYRMIRQSGKKQEVKVDITAGLIPQMQEGRSGAYLYDEINRSTSSKKAKEPEKKIMYGEDWQIRASSRVLALLFAANNLPHGRRNEEVPSAPSKSGDGRSGAHHHGQILPTTDFYNSMIDYTDLVADFENWESRKSKFTFCQYPFLLSIWAKNHILEHDARRQMQSKARDAFFDSIMSRKAINQFLELNVRRDCLVDDSLKAVSEVIGSGSEDIKKGLRITFSGEEGVDAGGLRKEWFLLLVREVFNPDHGKCSNFTIYNSS